MSKTQRKGAEEARTQLPAILDEAQKGRTTVITRRGRSIAAVVPIAAVAAARQRALGPLEGSGKGLWGTDSVRTIRRMRDEWSR